MAFVIDASIVAAFAFEETENPRVAIAMAKPEVHQAFALRTCSSSKFAIFLWSMSAAGGRRRSDPRRSCGTWRGCPFGLDRTPDNDDVVSLARERNLTVYDAAYLELAKREGLPLATLDRALEKAAIAEGVALFGE